MDSEHCLSIVVIDEIDSLVGSRNASNKKDDGKTDITTTLLSKMSGKSKNYLILGTTNYPNMIDDAVKRDGRFGVPISS